jgi:hypothetical protein
MRDLNRLWRKAIDALLRTRLPGEGYASDRWLSDPIAERVEGGRQCALVVETRAPRHIYRLLPGERCAVPPKTAHYVHGAADGPCKFLRAMPRLFG